MSKRRINDQIDDISNEVLGDLDPNQRLSLLLEFQREGKDHRVSRLIETCPRDSYKVADPAFMNRYWTAELTAYKAAFDLQSSRLVYEHRCMERDSVLSAGDVDDRLDEVKEKTSKAMQAFLTLHIQFFSYQRFAERTLGIELEELVALHPDGVRVLDMTTDIVDDQLLKETSTSPSGSDTGNGTGESRDRTTLTDKVERGYEELAESWEMAHQKYRRRGH